MLESCARPGWRGGRPGRSGIPSDDEARVGRASKKPAGEGSAFLLRLLSVPLPMEDPRAKHRIGGVSTIYRASRRSKYRRRRTGKSQSPGVVRHQRRAARKRAAEKGRRLRSGGGDATPDRGRARAIPSREHVPSGSWPWWCVGRWPGVRESRHGLARVCESAGRRRSRPTLPRFVGVRSIGGSNQFS